MVAAGFSLHRPRPEAGTAFLPDVKISAKKALLAANMLHL
jgi:hypothetical protein